MDQKAVISNMEKRIILLQSFIELGKKRNLDAADQTKFVETYKLTKEYDAKIHNGLKPFALTGSLKTQQDMLELLLMKKNKAAADFLKTGLINGKVPFCDICDPPVALEIFYIFGQCMCGRKYELMGEGTMGRMTF